MSILAAELGPDDLVLSHFTLGRQHPIDDRVEAARTAGFAAIGLSVAEVARLVGTGTDLGALADLIGAAGLCLADIEAIKGWGGGPDQGSRADLEENAWRMADRLGGRCLQAIGPFSGDPVDGARAFADLCDRAADHGLDVALEALPFTNIPNTVAALEIVERADRPNGGLCIDIWHHSRSGEDRTALERLDPVLIKNVQLSDGPIRPPTDDLADYKDDCLRHRVPPGEGQMDAVGFVGALLRAGTTVPWSIEVCNEGAWDRPGSAHAARCAAASRRVLERARAL